MGEVGGFKGPLDWLKIVADGNLFVTIFEKGPTGKLVGEDQFGNKYYEDESTSYNRKRWVVYKSLSSYNPSIVPPEWHGWYAEWWRMGIFLLCAVVGYGLHGHAAWGRWQHAGSCSYIAAAGPG